MAVFIASTLRHSKISEQQLPSKRKDHQQFSRQSPFVTSVFLSLCHNIFGQKAWKVMGAATRLLCYRHPNTFESMLWCPKIISTYTKKHFPPRCPKFWENPGLHPNHTTPLVFFHTKRPPIIFQAPKTARCPGGLQSHASTSAIGHGFDQRLSKFMARLSLYIHTGDRTGRTKRLSQIWGVGENNKRIVSL